MEKINDQVFSMDPSLVFDFITVAVRQGNTDPNLGDFSPPFVESLASKVLSQTLTTPHAGDKKSPHRKNALIL